MVLEAVDRSLNRLIDYGFSRRFAASKTLNRFFANFLRKYGTTSPAIVKGRHKPIKLVRQGGV